MAETGWDNRTHQENVSRPGRSSQTFGTLFAISGFGRDRILRHLDRPGAAAGLAEEPEGVLLLHPSVVVEDGLQLRVPARRHDGLRGGPFLIAHRHEGVDRGARTAGQMGVPTCQSCDSCARNPSWKPHPRFPMARLAVRVSFMMVIRVHFQVGLSMVDKVTKLAEDIQKRMEHAEDWEKIPTSIPGIFMVHMPDKELRVMLMFNPTDDAGNPTKRKGFYFGDMDTVEAARKAFTDGRLEDLLGAVSRVNGTSRRRPADEGDVFQV